MGLGPGTPFTFVRNDCSVCTVLVPMCFVPEPLSHSSRRQVMCLVPMCSVPEFLSHLFVMIAQSVQYWFRCALSRNSFHTAVADKSCAWFRCARSRNSFHICS